MMLKEPFQEDVYILKCYFWVDKVIVSLQRVIPTPYFPLGIF